MDAKWRKQNEREAEKYERYALNSLKPETFEKNVCLCGCSSRVVVVLFSLCDRIVQRCLQIAYVSFCACRLVASCSTLCECSFFLHLFWCYQTETASTQTKKKFFFYQMCFSVHFKWVWCCNVNMMRIFMYPYLIDRKREKGYAAIIWMMYRMWTILR